MIFRQLAYGPDGCASYLLGCTRAGEAAVVDPLAALGAAEYLMATAERNLAITAVIDSHIHADHVSCGRELAEACGCPYYLGEAARDLVRFPFSPLKEGDRLQVGRVEVAVLATPGHTPDSICLLVSDTGRCDTPWFVLTGDTLFVGDVGRPDLLLGDRSLDVHAVRERAELLFRSLHDKLLALPDHVEVYPGHFGGSACGGVNLSGKAGSTVWFERRFNLALQHPDPEAFAVFVAATVKPLPRDYQRIKRINLGLEVDSHASP